MSGPISNEEDLRAALELARSTCQRLELELTCQRNKNAALETRAGAVEGTDQPQAPQPGADAAMTPADAVTASLQEKQ
jgi:hypothetical protein